MKIAMICDYPLKGVGSGMPYLKGLTYHLSQINDIDIHIMTYGNANRQYRENRVTFHILKRILRAFLMIPMETWRLKREIIKLNPDIVHVQSTGIPNCTAAVIVRNKYPTLLSVHGILAEMAKFRRGLELLFFKLVAVPLERQAIAKIPNIIAVSHYQKNLISINTNSKIYVIPPGIDFKNISNLKSDKPLKHPSLFFIGGLLGERKGTHILLKATQIIKSKHPDIYVYIAGSGPQELELRKLSKELNIEENIAFLGRISDDEKWTYYKSVDICVIPSLWEGMPTVLFEAMMCGKPVVASDVDGIAEVLVDNETGLLCEAGNAADLADKIVTLVQNQEMREEMGKAGEIKVREFTFDKIAGQTVKLYREILRTSL